MHSCWNLKAKCCIEVGFEEEYPCSSVAFAVVEGNRQPCLDASSSFTCKAVTTEPCPSIDSYSSCSYDHMAFVAISPSSSIPAAYRQTVLPSFDSPSFIADHRA